MAKLKITRETILKGAAEVLRKEGAEGLNARRIARELNCSTQPVYSQFKNMEELTAALREEAKVEYRRRIDGYLAESSRNRYEAYGMGYVRFAREEKGLFRFLNAGEEQKDLPRAEDPYLFDIIEEMKVLYGMDEARARAFHADMSIYSHGLAVLVNTESLSLTDEEIEERLRVEFYALYAVYFPERPPLPYKTEKALRRTL